MENLSNLSNTLPPTKAVNEQTIKEIDMELNQEFRDAANAVASLYKLSLQKKTIIRHQGYLDCLNDLLNVIKNDGDVESWVISKRTELNVDHESSSTFFDREQPPQTTEKQQDIVSIPQDTKFTISNPIDHKFRPTMPLLSVDYSSKRQEQMKKNQTTVQVNGSKLPIYDIPRYLDEETDDHNTIFMKTDHQSVKRTLERVNFEKRQKLDPT